MVVVSVERGPCFRRGLCMGGVPLLGLLGNRKAGRLGSKAGLRALRNQRELRKELP